MAYYPPVDVAEPRSSTAHIVIAWVLAVLTAFYLLPWAIAATRSHPNTVTIALLNVFLGWSGVGWLATLIWACISPSRPAVIVPGVAVTPVAPYYPVAALPPGAVSSASVVSAYPVSSQSAAYPYGPVGNPYGPPPNPSSPYGTTGSGTGYPGSAITAYPVSGPSAAYPAYQPAQPAQPAPLPAQPTGWASAAPGPFPTSASTANFATTQSLPADAAPTQPLPADQAWPVADWQGRPPDAPSGFHG